LQNPLPIWIGVDGTPESFVRAGLLGLLLMVAIIGGETYRFRPLIDLYRVGNVQALASAHWSSSLFSTTKFYIALMLINIIPSWQGSS
jgi:alkanesulfonate monooxygenase SsuD/methylene tetrahydromethanopterin reductase-like flavin-dependent oxidoreductase (luciferase family)